MGHFSFALFAVPRDWHPRCICFAALRGMPAVVNCFFQDKGTWIAVRMPDFEPTMLNLINPANRPKKGHAHARPENF